MADFIKAGEILNLVALNIGVKVKDFPDGDGGSIAGSPGNLALSEDGKGWSSARSVIG